MIASPAAATAVAIGVVLTTFAAGGERVPWTTSRIHGSPEPALPYVAERALHQGTFGESTELDFVPGTSWVLVIEQRRGVSGFDRNAPGEIVHIADFREWNGGNIDCFSIAFDPQWEQNHFAYFAFSDQTKRPWRSKVVRFVFKPGAPPVLDLNSGKSIIEWDSAGHKGGDLQFGPDGFLYVAIGDGQVPAPPDPARTGQDISDLRSSILRIDVAVEDDATGYRIPGDNPFVTMPKVRPEVWAYGMRNPWKMHFDPRDGALWIGDVGWEWWEMVFRVDHGGFNGGWSIVEGPLPVHADWPIGPTPVGKPVISHSHSESTSVTGGIVYRGDRLPELRDAYVYGDWGTGKLWALWWENGRITRHIEVANTQHRIIGFAEDDAHELYYMDYADGAVYRLARNPEYQASGEATGNFPRRLSETGLFESTSEYLLAPGVYAFEITAPMWSDHATAAHAVAFPERTAAALRGNTVESPAGAALVRTVSMEMVAGQPESARRIETQLMHFDGIEWRGYSYRWNAEQTDADLVDKDGAVDELEIVDADAPNQRRMQSWRFHSRAECVRCHLVDFHQRHGNLNALTVPQLGRPELGHLIDLGLIAAPAPTVDESKMLIDPHAANAPLERRARSYLHANCAHCHKPGSSGAVTMYWPVDFDPDHTGAFNVRPERGEFGISDARIVSPGLPGHSTVLYRMLTTGNGRMPATGSREVDEAGALLLRQWIASLPDQAMEETVPDSLDNTASAIDQTLDAITMNRSQRSDLVAAAMQSPNSATRDLFQRFLPPGQRRRLLGPGFDPAAVLALTGDQERGRALFHSPTGPQCSTCHQVEGKGRALGPDLSAIGARYSRDQLLHQIANPNASIEPQWYLHLITVGENNETHTGFITTSDEKNLRLINTLGTEVVIATDQVTSNIELPTSLMPEGNLDNLTAQEAADLLAFLLR